MEREIKAVAFDIDGTLMPGISWLKLTEELGGSIEKHREYVRKYRGGEMDYETAHDGVLSLWTGSKNANREAIGRMFHSWPLRPDARGIFDYLSGKGYKTCLITGSLDFFAEIIAERVGTDTWYANSKFVWDEKNNLKNFEDIFSPGKRKLDDLQKFCQKHGLSLGECAMVGDDANDIEVFEACGHGIAVESPTSHKLENYAWKKVKNLEEIKGILG